MSLSLSEFLKPRKIEKEKKLYVWGGEVETRQRKGYKEIGEGKTCADCRTVELSCLGSSSEAWWLGCVQVSLRKG